jgi:hypothetical protein
VLHVTILSPTILRQFLLFLKICAPLVKTLPAAMSELFSKSVLGETELSNKKRIPFHYMLLKS